MEPDGAKQRGDWLPCTRVQRAWGDFRDEVNLHLLRLHPALQRPRLRCHYREKVGVARPWEARGEEVRVPAEGEWEHWEEGNLPEAALPQKPVEPLFPPGAHSLEGCRDKSSLTCPPPLRDQGGKSKGRGLPSVPHDKKMPPCPLCHPHPDPQPRSSPGRPDAPTHTHLIGRETEAKVVSQQPQSQRKVRKCC